MKSLSTTELIGQLLTQAENAGTPEERDAFYAAAQKKATRLGIDMAMARAAIEKISEREKPTHRHIVLGKKGQRALSWYVELFCKIASANDLRVTMAHNSTYINLYGMPSDIDVAEAIYNSCIVAMVAGGDAYLREGSYKQDVQRLWKKWREPNPEYKEGGYNYDRWDQKIPKYVYTEGYKNVPISGMTARQNFYRGFVGEIGKRLREAKEEARAEAIQEEAERHQTETSDTSVPATSTELVLKEKSKEIAEYYEEETRGRLSRRGWKGSKSPVHHSGSQSAGRSAAQSVDLGGRKALPGPRTQIRA